MKFAKLTSILLCMLLAWVDISLCSSAPEDGDGDSNSYVRDACSVTRYNDVCMRSLASYSNTAERDPRKWARAGVSVTIGEAKHVAEYLVQLNICRAGTRERNRVALSDCIDLFGDTLDKLHSSLGVLRNLSSQNFYSQMEDVTTWISAALTDEDTCLEGFSNKKRFALLQNRVLNVTYMTSNALALVNKLATTGPEHLENP